MYRDVHDLERTYADAGFRARFAGAYAIRTILARAFKPADFGGLPNSGGALVLSPEGKTWRDRLSPEVRLKEDEAATVMLMKLAHQDLFVDVLATDWETIWKSLESDIAGNRIRLPWLFSRDLYDKYFEEVGQQRNSLTAAETGTLLEDTPQGVFQLGAIVVGPMGVVTSSSLRSMEPTRYAALWNCSDLSCRTLHTVHLDSFESEIDRAVRRVRSACELEQGPASDWDRFYWHLTREPSVLNDMSPADLPYFLGYAVADEERRAVLAFLLQDKDYRSQVGEQVATLELERPPSEVASSLGEAAAFQLLLMASDEALVTSLDALITAADLSVPPTEIRSNPLVLGRSSRTPPVRAEASVFGVRFVPRTFPIGLNRLRRLIHDVYSGTDSGQDLEWKLRGAPGATTNERLDNYLMDEPPRKAIRELVFASPARLRAAFSFLRYGAFRFPETPEDEEWTVSQLMWKLGFPTRAFPTHHQRLWEQVALVRAAASAGDLTRDVDRQELRGHASNLFVLLEEALDLSLGFATWALLTDHFGESGFTYDPDVAREFMAARLDGTRGPDTIEPLVFDPRVEILSFR